MTLLFILIALSSVHFTQSSQLQNGSLTYDCFYRCQSCTDVGPSSCKSCYANYILNNSTCVPCADNCLSCVAATGLCETCASQFYLSQSTWTCKPCPVGAQTCTFSAIQQCLSGYYLVNSICFYCISNCQTCSDAYSCLVCNSGYYLTPQLTCSPCQIAHCSSCDSTGTCSLCSNNRYGSKCDQLCPAFCVICDISACYQCNPGYYQTSGGSCQALSVLCESGIDPFTCISCIRDISFLDGSDCYPYTFVHLNNRQLYHKPLNEMNRFSGELASCGNYLLAKSTYSLRISLQIQPSYQLKIKIQVMTRINLTKSITISSTNLKEIFNGNISSTYSYQCLNDSWVFSNFQTIFTPIFTISNANQLLNLSISGQGQIGVGQLLVEQYLCLVNQCGLCLSAYSCMQCLSPYHLQNNKCLIQCSSGYYLTQQLMTCSLSCPSLYFPNLADYSCTPCISPCFACKSSSQCLSCVNGWFLLGNTCQTSCPNGYYKNSSLNSCVACQYPCGSCDYSASNCTSCSLGFFDKANYSCVMSCSVGYFSNFSTITCNSCSPECLTCQFSPFRCTSCASLLFLNPNSTCLSSCDSTYAANNQNNICQKCLYPCRTCNTSSISCLTCYAGYLQENSCISTCPNGTYSDFQFKKCLSCPDSCLTCVSKLQCTSCKSGLCYSSSLQACFSVCPNGSFANYNFICSPCKSPCSECTNLTYCLSCQGYLFVYNQGSCLLSCPKSKFVVINQTTNMKFCQPCGANCSVCISSTVCITCINSSLYQGSCLSKCPQTTYDWKGVCNNCSFPCNTCKKSDICLSCAVGYYYYNISNSCLRICPSGFYQSGQQCLDCNPICQLCNDASAKCVTCAIGYFKNSNGTCSQSCGFGEYRYAIQRICKKCGSPCVQCIANSLCTTCNVSSIYPYLFRKSCIAVCPNGHFSNSNYTCQKCSSNCLSCSKSSDNCTQCDGEHYLFSNLTNKCVNNCPDSYYPNSASQCTPCLPPCLLCASRSVCLSCISLSYTFYNGYCLSSCPFGYYSSFQNNANYCQICDQSCLQCVGNSFNCTQCSPGLYLQSQSGSFSMKCVKNCPLYSYPDVDNQICLSCVSPCSLCFTASRCITCLSVFVLQFDSCLLTCLSGYYKDGGICKLCVSPCATCTSNSSCLSCVANYYFDQSLTKCLNQCPPSTYSFQTSNRDMQCLSCPTSCLQCFDSISCRSCHSDSLLPYLQGTTCQATCTDGYYPITGSMTCQWCGWGCFTCNSSGFCTQCTNSYLYGGVCQTQCPIGYYGTINFSCQMCISPCYDCYNSANCKYCIPGYFLYLTHCLSKCPNDQWAIPQLSICNQTCNSPYFKIPSQMTCVTSCPAYYDANGNCLDLCPSQLMANQTFGCQVCETSDCSKRLQYQLNSYQKNGKLYILMVFNQPIDNLNYFNNQSFSLFIKPSVVIDPSQLHLSGLRTLTQSVTITNSVTIVDRQQLFITLQANLQPYEQVFSGIIAETIKDLSDLTFGGYPLQNPNATVTLDQFQTNNGGQFTQYLGKIVSGTLILLYFINFFCGSQRNVILAIDGIQTIHVLFYLSVWNHPLLENYMLGLRFATLRSLITNFGINQNLWNCPPKQILLYGYCNTYLQLVFPLLVFATLLAIVCICRVIAFFEGKHNFLWNHVNSIWWITGMSFGISAYNGIGSNDNGQFFVSLALIILFLLVSLVISFKVVQNVYSNSFTDSCFFWDLKKKKAQHILSNLHCLLMVVRRVVMVIAASLGYESPLSSLFVVTLFTICIFSNTIINQPFKNNGLVVGAAQLLFGIILVLIQMFIVNTSRLSNSVWNGFGTTIFILVFIYTILLLCLAMKETFKTVKKLYIKQKQSKLDNQKKEQEQNKSEPIEIKKNQKQSKKQQVDNPKQQEKIGDQTQHHLIKTHISSKLSSNLNIFQEANEKSQNDANIAPKMLMKIQKQKQ